MKKQAINVKLSLGKDVLSQLTNEQASGIVGGEVKPVSWDTSCSNVRTIVSVCLGSTCAA